MVLDLLQKGLAVRMLWTEGGLVSDSQYFKCNALKQTGKDAYWPLGHSGPRGQNPVRYSWHATLRMCFLGQFGPKDIKK